MQDTSSAANHRWSDRAHRANGLEALQAVEEDTWFEVVSAPPRDTPLIALVPLPRGELSGGG
jgi:hypothetical protein